METGNSAELFNFSEKKTLFLLFWGIRLFGALNASALSLYDATMNHELCKIQYSFVI